MKTFSTILFTLIFLSVSTLAGISHGAALCSHGVTTSTVHMIRQLNFHAQGPSPFLQNGRIKIFFGAAVHTFPILIRQPGRKTCNNQAMR
jgi:hypothetical protein